MHMTFFSVSAASPKPPILYRFSYLLKKMFSGLRLRCAMPGDCGATEHVQAVDAVHQVLQDLEHVRLDEAQLVLSPELDDVSQVAVEVFVDRENLGAALRLARVVVDEVVDHVEEAVRRGLLVVEVLQTDLDLVQEVEDRVPVFISDRFEV